MEPKRIIDSQKNAYWRGWLTGFFIGMAAFGLMGLVLQELVSP